MYQDRDYYERDEPYEDVDDATCWQCGHSYADPFACSEPHRVRAIQLGLFAPDEPQETRP